MKLKPCPFCGGEVEVILDEECECWKIRCKNIGCDVRPSTSWFFNKEEAIETWNRREPVDKIVEQLEKAPTLELPKGWERLLGGNGVILKKLAIEIVKKGGLT